MHTLFNLRMHMFKCWHMNIRFDTCIYIVQYVRARKVSHVGMSSNLNSVCAHRLLRSMQGRDSKPFARWSARPPETGLPRRNRVEWRPCALARSSLLVARCQQLAKPSHRHSRAHCDNAGIFGCECNIARAEPGKPQEVRHREQS